MLPAVVSVAFEPALPLGPVKFPTSHSFLIDRLRKPVIVFWLVRHFQFGRITTQAKTSPLRTGTRESPERDNFERLATVRHAPLFAPRTRHAVHRGIEHGGEFFFVVTQIVQRRLTNIRTKITNCVVNMVEWQVERQLSHLFDQRIGLCGRTCAAC